MDLHRSATGIGKDGLHALPLESLHKNLAALARLHSPVRHARGPDTLRGSWEGEASTTGWIKVCQATIPLELGLGLGLDRVTGSASFAAVALIVMERRPALEHMRG